MNKEQLRQELADDEGCKYEIYLDHLGLPTFGIGHLVRDYDPENGQPVGTPVSEERVRQAFNLDIIVTLEDCDRLYPDFDELPEEAQLVIANMCFNLGYTPVQVQRYESWMRCPGLEQNGRRNGRF